jgi:hypothetical protein
MKKDVTRDGNRITIKPRPDDFSQKVRGLASKKARLTDEERDALLLAIAQRLGLSV